MNAPDSPIIVATDSGEASWTPVTEHLDPRKHDTSDIIAGGYILGATDLVRRVWDTLDVTGPETVSLTYWCDHTFTEGRDTLVDVIAALVDTGGGRGSLSDNGWDYLYEHVPGLRSDDEDDPDENDDGLIDLGDGWQLLPPSPDTVIY